MKVLVVDDEPLARERLKRMLAQRGDCEAIVEAANGMEAVEQNAAQTPDVILMDIRMPGMDGLEAARHIVQAERPPAIIFCTAYEEYAIAAFESRAVGYLLKPVQAARLDAALVAARTSTRLQVAALPGERRERQFLSSRTGGGTRLLPVSEVRALLADQKYVTAHHPGGSLLLDESLRDLEEEFGERFLRVHRNALVAVAHVTGIARHPGGEQAVTLAGMELQVPISRRLLVAVRDHIAHL